MKRIFTLTGLLFLFMMAIGLTTGCAARINPRESLAAMQSRAPEGSPKLLAIYQPWFG